MGFEVDKSEKLNVNGQTDWNRVGFVNGSGTTTERTNYIFKEKISKPGIYLYRLKQIDFDGTVAYSPEVEIDVTGPREYALYQNYPNPFNPTTTIKFALPVKTNLVIAVYNSIAEKVSELFKGELDEGYHEVEFNAASLSSGIYFYRLESDSYVDVKKMILLK